MTAHILRAGLLLLVLSSPSWAQQSRALGDKPVLVITIVMPRDVPDVRHTIEEKSIDECWADAKEFVSHGTPKIEHALGVMAACLVPKDTGDDL
jgi:hypothetical protein